jgi:hypothetical protein
MTIDGERTVEIDYTGIHLAILYARAGCGPIDPYELPGLTQEENRRFRPTIKHAVLILINAENDGKAAKALREEIQQSKNDADPLQLPSKYQTAQLLFDAIRDRHSAIARAFGSGEGIRAQFTDSRIAEHVMCDLDGHGITVLPIHDSFIVQARHAEQLRSAMVAAFKDIMDTACPVYAVPDCGEDPKDWHDGERDAFGS